MCMYAYDHLYSVLQEGSELSWTLGRPSGKISLRVIIIFDRNRIGR